MKANRILVPLDGSETAEAAIAPAVEMARRRGANARPPGRTRSTSS